MSSEIMIVREWDQMPPVVHSGDEIFSTRALEKKYRDMETKLGKIKKICDIWSHLPKIDEIEEILND